MTREGRRRDVLRVLRTATTPLTIAQIAAELGVHPNTVRFHLDRLMDTHQVEHASSDQRGPGRPPLSFRLVRRMDPGGPRHYRLLAEILVHNLAVAADPGAAAAQAGREWGRRLSPPSGAGQARRE